MRLNTILSEAPHDVGGWVTPDGNYSFTGIHVYDILKHPEKFGLTHDFIDATYARHGEEKMVAGRPNEGDAREELISLVLKKGWVRFRKYRNYWSVNVYSWDRKTLEQLKGWIRAMVKTGDMGKYDTLKISDFRTESLHDVEADDILRNRIHEQIEDDNNETF